MRQKSVKERLRLALIEKWRNRIDPLTGLYVRSYAERQAERRSGVNVVNVVVLLDLDGFKQVNDTRGHAGGDKVLRQVGKVLQDNTRNTDLAFRLGGDEFGILFYNINPEHIANKLEQIRAEIGKIPGISASIGFCIADSEASIHDNIRRADEALYEAKRDGKNCVRKFWNTRKEAA